MALPTSYISRELGAARTNLGDKLRREPIADLRRTPRELVGRTKHAELYRYDPAPDVEQHGKPVLVGAGLIGTLAPMQVVTHLCDLVTGAPDADLVQAPGGHPGVLTCRAARTPRGRTWRSSKPATTTETATTTRRWSCG